MEIIGGLFALLVTMVLIIAIIAFYFLPAIIAFNRKHNNAAAILVLNLFLGWTFLGWVVCCVWAFTDNVAKEESPAAEKE